MTTLDAPTLLDPSNWIAERLKAPQDERPFDALATISFHPVGGGEHRVLHVPGDGTLARPVVFVPGWGATMQGWKDFYGALQGRVELYVIETLEKSTSKIDKSYSDRSMLREAHNIQSTLDSLGLDEYVLFGSCWGASLLLEGLIDGLFRDPPAVMTYDPMHFMWFSPAFLKYVAPWLPVPMVEALKGVIQAIALRNFAEPRQLERVKDFVANADAFRWKNYSIPAADFELYGRLHHIEREILVFNGSSDTIHSDEQYPEVAKQLPKGRFFYHEVDESQRERLAALGAEAMASVTGDTVPEVMRALEQPLER